MMVIRTEYLVPNQMPCASRLRSKYGMAAKKPRAMVGRRTPAHALSMCSNSSCRLRKYQGALEGLGVTSVLARFRRGALIRTERMTKVIVNRTAEMNSTKTRSGQTRTSSSRSRFGRGRAAPGARPGTGGASIAMGGKGLLERPRHAAVAADPPEVDGHENSGQQRQSDDVQGVEADERVGTDLVAAEDDELRLVAEVGCRARDAVADGDGPECKLVPRKQVTGEREHQRED